MKISFSSKRNRKFSPQRQKAYRLISSRKYLLLYIDDTKISKICDWVTSTTLI